tara:strand:+ start:1716 stop:3086 length:1371 start_codon:yes stop_codon:yes gene_type:complete
MGLLNETAKSYYEGKDGVQNSGDEFYGSYQFTSLENVISQFIIAYVGNDKIIPKIKRTDVAFHAQRALQELSFDTFKSCKSMELEVPNSLQLPLPQDYVNYVKLSWVDNAGIQRVLQPASKTSNPLALQQNADGSLKFENNSYQLNATDPFSEYGIMSTSQSSVSTGNGELLSTNPLPQFEKETRIALKNTSGYQSKYEVQYGAATGAGVHNMLINFFTAGHDIEVGMRIYGPGIPANSTVVSVGDTTNSNYPGMGILFTNPEYKKWLLDGQPTTINPGAPVSGSLNSNYYKTEEVIFVNLNRKSDTSTKYQSSENRETTIDNNDYDHHGYDLNKGQRYGLDPQHAQTNGSYYIDCMNGLVNFSSNISGRTVTIEYISDSLGTDSEMKVHKFAEEAMYKCIAYAIMSTRANIQEYVIQRFKRERFAETRKAKLRLSNFKIEELTQILRGKSKIIKH